MKYERCENMDISILYEDNHVIVCEKPTGVLSQGGDMDRLDMVNLLKEYLKKKYDKPGNVYLGLVHRLDLNVGGLMVFAKTSKAAARLSEQVRTNFFSKHYLAIAKGKFTSESGRYEDLLEKDETTRTAKPAGEDTGRLATLAYECLESRTFGTEVYSLVDISLETGRFHQIRFQFSEHGHPLMGDTKYGDQVANPDFFLGLYAYRIDFEHPTTKEKLTFSKRPEDKRFTVFEGLEKIDWR